MSSESYTDKAEKTGIKVKLGKYYCNTCGAELYIGQDCPNCSWNIKPEKEIPKFKVTSPPLTR